MYGDGNDNMHVDFDVFCDLYVLCKHGAMHTRFEMYGDPLVDFDVHDDEHVICDTHGDGDVHSDDDVRLHLFVDIYIFQFILVFLANFRFISVFFTSYRFALHILRLQQDLFRFTFQPSSFA